MNSKRSSNKSPSKSVNEVPNEEPQDNQNDMDFDLDSTSITSFWRISGDKLAAIERLGLML